MMTLVLLNYVILLLLIAAFNRFIISPQTAISKPSIDVIIPFRNEGEKPYSQALELTKSPAEIKSIIFVNDHSSDNGLSLLKTVNNSRLQILESNLPGKKNALSSGVNAASSDWLLFLDADVLIDDQWITNVIEFIAGSTADIVVFPLRIVEGSVIEQLDFLALQSTTVAFSNLKSPILANGAALAIKRSLRIELNEKIRPNIASGDDVFLIHEASKMGKLIAFAGQKNLIANTLGNPSLKHLLHQRIRWGAKAIHYKNATAWYVSASVLLFSMMWIAMPFLFIFEKISLLNLLCWVAIKLGLDLLTLIPTAIRYNQKHLIPHIFWLSPIHPALMIFSALAGFIVRPIWKDRPA